MLPKQIVCLLSLHDCFKNNVSLHYPIEIVKHIISLLHKLILKSSYCGGLLSMDVANIYHTGSPNIYFFKIVYRRHTNFAIEH